MIEFKWLSIDLIIKNKYNNMVFNDIKKMVKDVYEKGLSDFELRCFAYGLNLTQCALFCALYEEEYNIKIDI
jgi:hypothetical protein